MPQRKAFTLIELLVSVTIIGILITLVTVSVLPIQKKSRDSRRKADVNLLISGLSLFNSDFKVYPNSTFYLGSYTNSNKAKNSNYALGADVVSCNNATIGPTSSFTDPSTATPTQADLDTTAIRLKDGFESVNNFLVCLKYMDRIVQDPLFVGTDRYQYRVSYDYAEFLVGAKLENQNDAAGVTSLFTGGATYSTKWFFDGNGKNARQLDDDSDTNAKFYTFTAGSGTALDGKYFYQCVRRGDGAVIDEDKRPDFPPLVNTSGTWTANVTGDPTKVCANSINNGGTDLVSRSSN